MVGDLFHRGHVEFLSAARKLGDPQGFLMVGVHSDETCTRYKRKPIFSMEDRVAILVSCRFVDRVIPDVTMVISPAFMDHLEIDLVVHGDDMTDELRRCYAEPIRRNRFRTIPYYRGISTTSIIESILRRGNSS
jgi:cytidyltransferase-like protein